MTLLSCINEIREGLPSSVLDSAIDEIGDFLEAHHKAMAPEERDHTRFILERLLDLQAAAVRSATTRGKTMFERRAEEEREETDALRQAQSLGRAAA